MRKKSGNGSTPTVRNTGLAARCPAMIRRMSSNAENRPRSHRRCARSVCGSHLPADDTNAKPGSNSLAPGKPREEIGSAASKYVSVVSVSEKTLLSRELTGGADNSSKRSKMPASGKYISAPFGRGCRVKYRNALDLPHLPY